MFQCLAYASSALGAETLADTFLGVAGRSIVLDGKCLCVGQCCCGSAALPAQKENSNSSDSLTCPESSASLPDLGNQEGVAAAIPHAHCSTAWPSTITSRTGTGRSRANLLGCNDDIRRAVFAESDPCDVSPPHAGHLQGRGRAI
mmetsp:Transcript_35855/g.92262  ORF Transcript_35855/g.92262 Transcript_35855/m.92262 type:complete len:145 (-) Transcript_35855:312-746(-)